MAIFNSYVSLPEGMFFQNFPGFPKDQIRKASANVNSFNGHVRYLNWSFLELL